MTTNREWLFSLPLEEQIAWMESEHSEPNPNCSAMLHRMFTENMKHEPCNDYEPKDDVSGYGADFNVVEPNFDNLKAVEMDASRLVVSEPDSREKLEADIRWEVGHYFAWEEKREQFSSQIIEWLDRQAAITAEETSNAWEEYRDATQHEIAELTAELEKATNNLNSANEDFENARAELTAERDELQAQVGELRGEGEGE